MKGLSKSRYTTFCQCPKNLWLKIFKPEEATEDEGQQARFERGNQIGDLAMGLFGDFKEVTSHQEDGSMDLQKMIALTKQYMDEGVENICEASFSCEGGYCAVDILRKDGDGWAIYEVKSTSFPKFNGQESKLEKYAPDFAYQKWVLTQCGVNVTGTYLVCLNSDYVNQQRAGTRSRSFGMLHEALRLCILGLLQAKACCANAFGVRCLWRQGPRRLYL